MSEIRCGWCEKDDLYRDYHDKEWENLFMMTKLFLNSWF